MTSDIFKYSEKYHGKTMNNGRRSQLQYDEAGQRSTRAESVSIVQYSSFSRNVYAMIFFWLMKIAHFFSRKLLWSFLYKNFRWPQTTLDRS